MLTTQSYRAAACLFPTLWGLAVEEAAIQDAPVLARLHREVYFDTYASLLPMDVVLANGPDDWEELWRSRFSRAACTRLARSGGEAVGLVQAGDPYTSIVGCDAELYSIYVRPEGQGLGLGRALFSLACACLSQFGYSRVGVWTLASNPAVGFYASMGMQQVESREISLCGRRVSKVAFAINLAP